MTEARQAAITALLVAQDAFKDVQGRTHVYGIFDTLSAERFPVTPAFRVFCRIQGEGTHTVYVRIVDSLDDKLTETPGMACEVSPTKGHDLFLGFGLAFKAPGKYRVQAFLDGVKELETPLMVRETKPDQAER